MKRPLLAAFIALAASPAQANPSPSQQEVLNMPRGDTEQFLQISVMATGYLCKSSRGYRRIGMARTGMLMYHLKCEHGEYLIGLPRSGDDGVLVSDCTKFWSESGRTCASILPGEM